MRRFPDGAFITIEPWRAQAFPIIKDLVVDRSALDRIMQAGGYISVNTGGAVDGNVLLIGKDQAETAMDAASCIGCGACVAACKNASAMLFVAAKVSHLALLPQGKPERTRRVQRCWMPWTEKGSVRAATSTSVKPFVPKRSASGSSPSSIANISGPAWSNPMFPLSRNRPMRSPPSGDAGGTRFPVRFVIEHDFEQSDQPIDSAHSDGN